MINNELAKLLGSVPVNFLAMNTIKKLSLAAGFGAALALTFAGPAMAQDAAAPAAAHDSTAVAAADDTAAAAPADDTMGGHKGKKKDVDVDIKSDNDMWLKGKDQFCNAQGFVVIIKNSCNGNNSDNSANGIGGDWDGDVDSNEK